MNRGSLLADLINSDPTWRPTTFSLVTAAAFTVVPMVICAFAFFLIIVPTGTGWVEAPSGCRMLRYKPPVNKPDWSSNLDDELDAKYDKGSKDPSSWQVKSLFIYPVKSCRGIELSESEVVESGLKYDRTFAFARLLADPGKGVKSDQPWMFITQREFRLMSQVKTYLYLPDKKRPAYNENLPYVKTGGALVITFPWREKSWSGMLTDLGARVYAFTPEKSFIVPLNPTPDQLETDYTQEKFTIWKETITATNMGIHVPPEFKQYLGCSQPLTLMRVNKEREVFRAAPRKEKLGWQPVTGFADAFPIHIMGISSVHEADKMQPSGSPQLTCRRFRANIFVAGPPPFEEDTWKRARLGDHGYYNVCRCVRCTIPNIEPDTGERHLSQPRKTLREKRAVDTGAPGEGCLGMNMVPEDRSGTIRVGDPIVVLERGEQVYVGQ